VQPKSKIRPDIQVLRAIAIIAVVIYHIWPHALTGGFMGVDIFFVISGKYYRELNSTNMRRFYEEFKEICPFKIRKGQNDNGRENLREFVEKLKKDKVKQLFSYPMCPKINGYVERFNRTLREEFI
jgi:hypothetical protein